MILNLKVNDEESTPEEWKPLADTDIIRIGSRGVLYIHNSNGSIQPSLAEYTYRYLGDARQIPTFAHRYAIREYELGRGGFAGQWCTLLMMINLIARCSGRRLRTYTNGSCYC
jgi:hypothetical protein